MKILPDRGGVRFEVKRDGVYVEDEYPHSTMLLVGEKPERP